MGTYLNTIYGTRSYQPEALENRFSPVSQGMVIDSNRRLKQGIWLYFLLLIFEGALRKWLLPSLATPLLIIRDPLALWLVVATWQQNLLPANRFLAGMLVIGITGVFTAIFLGHGSLPVALFGARILLLHFPLLFVIGRIFNRDDVISMGKVTLWLAIPMALLITLQFYSPQSAWVNRGVGGDLAGAGFGGALGFFRPPGTFSFTNGTHLFFSFLAGFIFYFWLNAAGTNRILLIASSIALLIAIPFSISRTLLFQVVLSLAFAVVAMASTPKNVGQIIMVGLMVAFGLAILMQTSFLQTATEAFTARFEDANQTEGGLEGVFLDRFLGGLIGALSQSFQQPFFGYGIGMGTNVGSMLLSGTRAFLIDEGEWGRVIGELGPLMGIGVIVLRLGLATKIALACYQKLAYGDMLPWMLLSFGFLIVAQGQWAQPTALGFSTLIGGLMLATLRETGQPNKLEKD